MRIMNRFVFALCIIHCINDTEMTQQYASTMHTILS